MLIIIRYIFYLNYRLGHSYGRKDPTFLLGLIAMPIMFNLFTILSIIEILINAKFDVTKETVIVSTCLLFYAMYRYLATKESIIYIFKEFGKISKTKRYILNLSVPIYLILTGWIFYYTANIVKAMP